MKKLCLAIAFVILSISMAMAQGSVQFGATAGFINGDGRISIAGFDIGEISSDLDVINGSGFFVGLLADVEVAESFSVQPELLYAAVGDESVLVVPVMAKYYVADKINIQAGPQFDFLLDVPTLVKEAVKTVGFSLGLGAGYDINDNFGVQAKYTIGLNNRIDNTLSDLLDDLGFIGSLVNPELKINTFQVGVVYNFN